LRIEETGRGWVKVSIGEEVRFKWPDVLKTMINCIAASWLGNMNE